MRAMLTRIDPTSLPDLTQQAALTFDELAAYGAGEATKLLAVKPRLRCTKCGNRYADLQPDWSQRTGRQFSSRV
jgi:hypothetical protein